MKKQLIAWFLVLAGAFTGVSQPADEFVNDIILITSAPPQIDARSFINNAVFQVTSSMLAQYETSSTLNYTNYGRLTSSRGFALQLYSPESGDVAASANIYNAAGATINCGGTNSGGGFGGLSPELDAWATNIVNRGIIEMGYNGILRLAGSKLDLVGGLLNMEGFEANPLSDIGMFDSYWGATNMDMTPSAAFGAKGASVPRHVITNRNYLDLMTPLSVNAVPFTNITVLGPGFNFFQLVYVTNSSPTISNNVYFPPGPNGQMSVEWVWLSTNIVSGRTTTNRLWLYDDIYSVSNVTLVRNGRGPASIGYQPTYKPDTYTIVRDSRPSTLKPATSGAPPSSIDKTRIPVDYAAYQMVVYPFTEVPNDVAGRTFANMNGRMLVTASNHLDLSSSRISTLNYLNLSAPKNFVMDSGTRILTPVADYDLGSTNGSLVVSNLMAPTCPRLNGTLSLYSTRWTNTVTEMETNVITNIFSVLVVNSALNAFSPPQVQTLALRATNVYISDILNVNSNMVVDAKNVTVLTNAPGAANPSGQLNFLTSEIIWTNSFPRLENLTNYGSISSQNVAYFGGVRFAPFYPTSNVEPYDSFVNYGSMVNAGCYVWADLFFNAGVFQAASGSITIQSKKALVEKGVFTAPNGDVVFYADDLTLIGGGLNASRRLNLWVTNKLDDGGLTGGNLWTAGVGGFNLPILPRVSSMLGTTVVETSPPYAFVTSVWAAKDKGPKPDGFTNNAAVGKLTLTGGENSKFIFTGTTGNNALYIDYLDLKGFTTNRDSAGNLIGVQVQPGMKIYYADAGINGVSIAEKIDGKNGGTLVWVPEYAGAFSSTQLTYADGTILSVNRAMAASPNIDSNNDGVPNNVDPTPFFVPSQINLRADRKQGTLGTQLSWTTLGNSTNSVLYTSDLSSPEWTVLTNFVFGPVSGKASVVDPAPGNSRYYRVRVDSQRP